MNNIFTKADELGELISSSEEFLKYLSLKNKVEGDGEKLSLLNEYSKLVFSISLREKNDTPVEKDDYSALHKLKKSIVSSVVISEFILAREEFICFLDGIKKSLTSGYKPE